MARKHHIALSLKTLPEMPVVRLNLHSIAYPVTSLGPGRRLALWVAGCQKCCPGCISPERQDPHSGKVIAVSRLARHVLRLAVPIDGVTITGGEPFDQGAALADLVDRFRHERPEWNILAYSGYYLEEIESLEGSGRELLSRVDILIDGPYDYLWPSAHPLLGSGNQGIHYISPRGWAIRRFIETAPSGQFDLGIGRGPLNMLIGVNQAEERDVMLQELSIRPVGLLSEGRPFVPWPEYNISTIAGRGARS